MNRTVAVTTCPITSFDQPSCRRQSGEIAQSPTSPQAIKSALMSSPDRLTPLRRHPAYQVANSLAAYLGVEREMVHFVQSLSLAAGKMVMPVSLDIQTDKLTVDLHTSNRILDLLPDHVARVDTHRQFRALENSGFHLVRPDPTAADQNDNRARHPLAAILMRGNHQYLHRDVSEYTSRLLATDRAMPSLWRVADTSAPLPAVPATLRLQTQLIPRELKNFGCEFCIYRHKPEKELLSRILETLPCQPTYCNSIQQRKYRRTGKG